MVFRTLVIACGLTLSLYAGTTVLTNAAVEPNHAALETLEIQADSPTRATLAWTGSTPGTRYLVRGSVGGYTVLFEEAQGAAITLPVAPETAYLFTVSALNDATNAVQARFKTPAALPFHRYNANVYNLYIAAVSDSNIPIYEQDHTRVRRIRKDTLFQNMAGGYYYFIHMDVVWDATPEEKHLDNNVLVIRTPLGHVFAWDVHPVTFEGEHPRYYFDRVFNGYLEDYQDTGAMETGVYTFEFYTDGLLIGKTTLRID